MKGVLLFFGLLMLTACATVSDNKSSTESGTTSPKHVTAPPMMAPGY